MIQPGLEPYAVSRNLARLSELLGRAARQGARLAVLPEFFSTGNTLEEPLLETALEHSELVVEWLADQARETGLVVAGAHLVREPADGHVYNRFVVQEPDGASAHHDKQYAPVAEALYYRTSDEQPPFVVESSLGKLGLIICAEMFQEAVARADYADCALVLIVFAIPDAFRVTGITRRLTRVPAALARRNGVPVLLSSVGGRFHSRGSPIVPLLKLFPLRGNYAGRSGIHTPAATVAGPAQAGAVEVLVADIDLGPAAATPDATARIVAGVPLFMRAFDALAHHKARRLYEANLRSCSRG